MYQKLAEYCTTYDPNRMYGMFGYCGSSIDLVLSRDDPEAMQKAHDLGWIDPESKTLLNTPLLRLAKERGHVKVAELLTTLGYPG